MKKETLKRAVKALVPPVVFSAIKKFKREKVRQSIWVGVYESYETARGHLVKSDYSTSYELALEEGERVSAMSRNLFDASFAQSDIPDGAIIFPMVLAAISGPQARRLRILDYGGGAGNDFLQTVHCVRNFETDYNVVEVEPICVAGRRIFKNGGFTGRANENHSVLFFSKVPENSKVDVVYSKSGLQYSNNWMQTVDEFLALQPEFFVFLQLPISEGVPTFWTIQCNLPGSQMVSCFINRDDFVNKFVRCGYELRYHSKFSRIYDASGLPESHRFSQGNNFLFIRKKSL